jgi:hypothetical protein
VFGELSRHFRTSLLETNSAIGLALGDRSLSKLGDFSRPLPELLNPSLKGYEVFYTKNSDAKKPTSTLTWLLLKIIALISRN